MPKNKNINNKSKGKPKGKSPKKSSSNRPQPSSLPGMSMCAAKYAIACVNPWSPSAQGACVPSAPARPSHKVTAYVRGTATIGQNGVGFVAVAPALSNDSGTVWYTTGDFLGNSITAVIPGATGVIPAAHNGVYSASQLDSEDAEGLVDATGRMVSVGLSLQYTGTELDLGGSLSCFTDPDHQSINTFTSTDFDSRIQTDYSVASSSRTKCWLLAHGQTPHELDYTESANDESPAITSIRRIYPFSDGKPLGFDNADELRTGAVIMGSLITGTPLSTYRFEVVYHMEFIGRVTQTNQTPGFADVDGLGLCQSALGNLPAAKVASPRKSMSVLMKQELVRAARLLGPAAVKVGASLLAAAL